ncbi:MAG: aspartate 1-decarboxylase [Chlorobi bacterium]|nr:MAG: aspartate 1-decarboxylase [Bacteroidota bacterium]MBE2264888.1 aspartate 1-decarboxylase [Flavobacteriales bacterium]MBL1162016.1 aspartate 1-decarboxylase [Chlorobiota bacterium]MBW7854525.1 aspartate 1-decarboxylase [Candidatus Kapabacteria bacterium]MCC6332159.1 aspartate 1-decarboxylase [Ignavibacteria bacterium]
MQRIMFKSKLHRARVTQANLYYEGSLTIDPDLMEAADILAYEKVSVLNINNGERFDTYVIPGTRGSRDICVNGAAARKAHVNDAVIILTYTPVSSEEAHDWKPTVVLLDGTNTIVSISHSVEPYTIAGQHS